MEIVGLILMVIGFINAIWVLVIYALSLSSLFGAKLSKRFGTSNENTDDYIGIGKSFNTSLLIKFTIRVLVGVAGWIIYYFATIN